MNAQERIEPDLVPIEDLTPDHVRSRVRSPGLPNGTNGSRQLAHERRRTSPVVDLLLESTARGVAPRPLLEGARLPLVDDVRTVGLATVVGDLQRRHQPATRVVQ